MADDPSISAVLLFGGLDLRGPPPVVRTLQDTWSFTHDRWTQLIANTSCTPSTCPSPRGGAALAYDIADRQAVLFGGFAHPGGPPLALLNDTWVFSNGQWTNITTSAGRAPAARFDASMTYDSGDGYLLLFGGFSRQSGDLGDTWTFVHGTWKNITLSLSRSPEPRAAAAIADSPSGFVMLFGGESNGAIVQSDCANYTPYLTWWFYHNAWAPSYTNKVCLPHVAHGLSLEPGQPPPCGRDSAALGWSPKNFRFVLFGGYGLEPAGGACTTLGSPTWFNDTWLYTGPLGGTSTKATWHNDTLPGAPGPRELTGYASDFTDGNFLIFGGDGPSGLSNETWRYFAPVTARLTGPGTIQATAQGFDHFELDAFGGSGSLTYSFTTTTLKTSHPLSGTGCSQFTDLSTNVVPANGITMFHCSPDPTSYNVYRLSVVVLDTLNSSQAAYANYTLTVNPPETIRVYSELQGIFYGGFHVDNIFGVYAEISGQPVSSVTAVVDGFTLGFSNTNGSAFWWNSSAFDMSGVSAGSTLEFTASISDWSENASYPLTIVNTPDWLQQIEAFGQVVQSLHTWGPGPFDQYYSITQELSTPFAKLFSFNLPIPLLSGNYSLIPDIKLAFNESYSGNVSLGGTLSLNPPAISLGAFSLQITVGISVSGQFGVQPLGGGESTITWLSARITLTLEGDFSASIPIYGFTFDLFGQPIHIGFTLDIDVDPSFALSILLAPTTDKAAELASGIALAIENVLGEFLLPVKVAISFGIGLASVSIGGKLSLDVLFRFSPPPFEISNVWVNGSLFVAYQVLFWSGSWDFLGPGLIYHYQPTFLAPGARPAAFVRALYDNGSDAVWGVDSRLYNTTGYDSNVWSPNRTVGAAIAHIYPRTEVTVASGYDGGYLFYSNDRVSEPVRQALTVSGLRLDSGTNRLTSLPAPTDPGFLMSHPEATTLSDGSLYVLWQALPLSETAGNDPSGLRTLELHGAAFYPSNATWGAVRAWTHSGIAQSFAVDSSSGGGLVTALLSPTIFPSKSSPEWLASYNLSNGALVSNVSVHGQSDVLSVRGAHGWVALRDLENNFSVVSSASGAVVAVPSLGAAKSYLVSETFVPGSASTLLLRYRSVSTEQLVLYDLAAGQALGTVTVGGNTTDAEALRAGGTYYLLASTPRGIEGWTVTGGTVLNLTRFAVSGMTRFGVAQSGGSILLFSTVDSGTPAAPNKTLVLAEVPVPGIPLVQSRPGSTTPSGSSAPNYALYLGLAAGAVLLALAVVAVFTRKPGAPSPAPSSQSGMSPPSGAAR